MDLSLIKQKAKTLGIKNLQKSSDELIKAIQVAEGNVPCFKSSTVGTCNETACLWRKDCLSSD